MFQGRPKPSSSSIDTLHDSSVSASWNPALVEEVKLFFRLSIIQVLQKTSKASPLPLVQVLRIILSTHVSLSIIVYLSRTSSAVTFQWLLCVARIDLQSTTLYIQFPYRTQRCVPHSVGSVCPRCFKILIVTPTQSVG